MCKDVSHGLQYFIILKLKQNIVKEEPIVFANSVRCFDGDPRPMTFSEWSDMLEEDIEHLKIFDEGNVMTQDLVGS